MKQTQLEKDIAKAYISQGENSIHDELRTDRLVAIVKIATKYIEGAFNDARRHTNDQYENFIYPDALSWMMENGVIDKPKNYDRNLSIS